MTDIKTKSVHIRVQDGWLECILYGDGGMNMYKRSFEQAREYDSASNNEAERYGGYAIRAEEVRLLKNLLNSQ